MVAIEIATWAAESELASPNIFLALISRSIPHCELLQMDSNCNFKSIPEPALK